MIWANVNVQSVWQWEMERNGFASLDDDDDDDDDIVHFTIFVISTRLEKERHVDEEDGQIAFYRWNTLKSWLKYIGYIMQMLNCVLLILIQCCLFDQFNIVIGLQHDRANVISRSPPVTKAFSGTISVNTSDVLTIDQASLDLVVDPQVNHPKSFRQSMTSPSSLDPWWARRLDSSRSVYPLCLPTTSADHIISTIGQPRGEHELRIPSSHRRTRSFDVRTIVGPRRKRSLSALRSASIASEFHLVLFADGAARSE